MLLTVHLINKANFCCYVQLMCMVELHASQNSTYAQTRVLMENCKLAH